ncbi:hypothetical protein BJX66DRAFT_341079 [Aspergillus keveii]|uniref:Fucose-specific lectin n=1 Tax=Aspergillus keveii TaxID=714993 RepID=A0ABR4FWA3_9EURO
MLSVYMVLASSSSHDGQIRIYLRAGSQTRLEANLTCAPSMRDSQRHDRSGIRDALAQEDYKPGNPLEESEQCVGILQNTIDSTLSQNGQTQDHPETAIAAIAFGDKARVYVQVGAGEILEYQYEGARWTEGPVIAKAKEDTPIAAAAKGTDYVRYSLLSPSVGDTNEPQICV